MAQYIEFETEDQNLVLIEIDETKPLQPEQANKSKMPAGLVKVGLTELTGKVVTKAKTVFETAVEMALRLNVEAFYTAINALPNPPSDIEISFGLKATGEIGSFVIGKTNAEANFNIKLSWKSNTKPPKP